jgi:hypothetical protein
MLTRMEDDVETKHVWKQCTRRAARFRTEELCALFCPGVRRMILQKLGFDQAER